MADSTLREVLAESIARHQQGELTLAEAGYRRVLEMDPNQPDAWHLLGLVAHQTLDSETAIQRIRKSLELDPVQPKAQNNLGNIYILREEFAEAVTAYRQAIKDAPDYATAHRNLAEAMLAQGQLNEALECFQRALALEPQDKHVRLRYAATLQQAERGDEAEEQRRLAETKSDRNAFETQDD